MVKAGASDLILRAGGRPSTRVDGRIGFLPGRVPAAGALLEVLEGVMGADRMDLWRLHGSVDAALQLDGLFDAYKVGTRVSSQPLACVPVAALAATRPASKGMVPADE